MQEVEYYSLAATLYFMIAAFGILKRNKQKNIGTPVLFFLMACVFWSFTATIFISENVLAKKLAQYFYAYFSMAIAFFFMNFVINTKKIIYRMFILILPHFENFFFAVLPPLLRS